MTELENPDWHDALDRAVPQPAVPFDMVDRIDSSVRVTRRRRRWAAAGSSLAAVVVVVAAVTLPGSGTSAGQGPSASSPTPQAPPSSRLTASAIPSGRATTTAQPVAPAAAPTDPCTTADNPMKEQGLLPLPASFVPTLAFQCNQDTRTYPGDGTWQVLLGQRLNGDIAALVSALRQPDVPLGQVPSALPSGTEFGCAADLVISPIMVLYDATGEAVRARVPVDECDKPQAGVTTALKGLVATTVQVIKVQQSQSESQVQSGKQAVADGCETGQFKDLLSYPETDRLSKGGPISWDGPISLCLYADDAKDPTVGDFVKGARLSASAKAAVRDATDLPGSAKPCTTKHTQFLEVFDHSSYTTIEVGGCSRVQRPNDGLGAADPTAIAALVKSLS